MTRNLIAVVSLLTAIGCGGEASTAPPTVVTPPPTVVTATVFNRLEVPVSLHVGNVNYGTLQAAASTTLTLPPGTTTLEWRNSKFRFSDGTSVPDDLSGATVSLAQSLGAVDITNLVDGTPYISPLVGSAVADTISLQLVQPSQSRCLGWQFGVSGGSRWGYYRLEPGTTLRVYRGVGCRGASRSWSQEILGGFTVRTGTIRLFVDQLP